MTIVLLVMLAVAGLPGADPDPAGGRRCVLAVHGRPSRPACCTTTRSPGSPASCIRTPHTSRSTQKSIYNLKQSKNAIGSGGMFGKGLFHGAPDQPRLRARAADRLHLHGRGRAAGLRRRHPRARPARHSSPGGCLRAAQLARDTFGRLLCAGIFTFLAFSVFQNAGMTMGIMPITGIPLPFLSYGGSAAALLLPRRRRDAQRVRPPERLTWRHRRDRSAEAGTTRWCPSLLGDGGGRRRPSSCRRSSRWSPCGRPSPPARPRSSPSACPRGWRWPTPSAKVPTPRPLTHELFATVLGRPGGGHRGGAAGRPAGGAPTSAELAISSARGHDVLVVPAHRRPHPGPPPGGARRRSWPTSGCSSDDVAAEGSPSTLTEPGPGREDGARRDVDADGPES